MGVGTLYLWLLMSLACAVVHSHYVAMFPASFRPGWDYQGQITVLNTQAGSSVTVRADIRDYMNNTLVFSTVTVHNGQTGLLSMAVPKSFVPTNGNQYTLKVQGTGGLTFVNTTDITLDLRTSLTFVQTDKGIYKPSDLVRFRVVTVDQALKPQKVQRTITVKNPMGSALRKYIDDGTKAVYDNTFQLTEFPDFGEWMIFVESVENNIEVEFPFKVEEYVLPKFEVSASVLPTFLIRDKGQTKVTVTITAKYTYGKGVTGDVKVKTAMQTIYDKITDTSGVKEVMIDVAGDMKTDQMRYSDQLTFDIEVTDETQRTYTTSTSIKIANQPYVVDFDRERSDTVFRTGTALRVVVKVTDPTGHALGGNFAGNLLLKLKDSSGVTIKPSTLFPIVAGTTHYVHNFEPINTPQSSLYAEATLTDTRTEATYMSTLFLDQFKTLGNSTLNLRTLSDQLPTMFQQYALSVDAYPRDGFQSIQYLVVSRGGVQRQGSVVDNSFTLTMTPDLCPEVEVIAYGLTKVTASSSLPEIIADNLKFSLTGCQDKELTPSVPQQSLRTGSDAVLSMSIDWTDNTNTAAVGQHEVFMLAVDKSILLLQGSKQDLSPARVDEELRKLTVGGSSSSGSSGGRFMMDARPGIMPPYSSAYTTTGQLLKGVGLSVLSDVDMSDMVVPRWDEGMVLFAAVPVAADNIPAPAPPQVEDDSAMAAGKPADSSAKTTTVRKDFPDTWIWKSAHTDDQGQLTFVEKLPDTITSWVISAFAVRNDSNLVVTRNPFELAAFNPFFVDLNLPYSIRRNEIFILRCTVFNYDPELPVMQGLVNLMPSPDFDINDGDSKPFMVKVNSGYSVEFNITAKTVKTINITVTASDKAQRYADIVTKTLIVKPEGEARSKVDIMPVMLNATFNVYEKVVNIDYSPWTSEQIVPQSKRVTAKITADMMGNVLNNIEDLVTQPTGCGEQNMITTIPNIYAMKYLVAVKGTTVEFNNTAKQYMVKGYQKETQEYRHQRGYSAFGTSDPEPSTWLTAFVVRSFAQASAYIPGTVDLGLLSEDVNYTLSTWSPERQLFLELGRVIHDDMQGGSAAGDALTVYVTMCLMEAKMAGISVEPQQAKLDAAFAKVSNMARQVLTIANSNDEKEKTLGRNLFLAAITAYTLTLQKPVDVQTVNSLIDYIAITNAPWKMTAQTGAGNAEKMGDAMMTYPHTMGPSPIEITSYCVLAYLGTGLQGVGQARDLVMWLQTKQSSLGGYSSTQDTVLALQAISEYATVFSKSADSTVYLTPLDPPGEAITISIDDSNKRILHIVQLPPETRQLKVKVTGSTDSFSLVKVVWDFHTMPQTDKDSMKLTSTAKVISPNLQTVETRMELGPGVQYNNMLIVTVSSQSCWAMDDIMEAKRDNPKVKRIEQDNNLIHFYLDKAENLTLTHKQTRLCDIQNAQPGSVVAYAYYKPEELRAETNLMMVNCGGNCVADPSGHAPCLTPLSGVLLTAVICLLLSLLVAT